MFATPSVRSSVEAIKMNEKASFECFAKSAVH